MRNSSGFAASTVKIIIEPTGAAAGVLTNKVVSPAFRISWPFVPVPVTVAAIWFGASVGSGGRTGETVFCTVGKITISTRTVTVFPG